MDPASISTDAYTTAPFEGAKAVSTRVPKLVPGPGIPPAFRAHVFRRFAQADSGDTRARGGTGLGLSIAKAIVDKLEGRISFETEMGTGTTFTIELPAAADAAPAATEAPAAGRTRG